MCHLRQLLERLHNYGTSTAPATLGQEQGACINCVVPKIGCLVAQGIAVGIKP